MSRKEIDSFVIGGTKAGASLPGERLQRMLGTRIAINTRTHTLTVPTRTGIKIAGGGDRVVLYDDGSLEVEYGEEGRERNG